MLSSARCFGNLGRTAKDFLIDCCRRVVQYRSVCCCFLLQSRRDFRETPYFAVQRVVLWEVIWSMMCVGWGSGYLLKIHR